MSEPPAKPELGSPATGSPPSASKTEPAAETLYDELRFDAGARADGVSAAAGSAVANGGGPGRISCASCHAAISGRYFTVNEKTVCPNCAQQVQSELERPTRKRGAPLLLGSLAAAAGSLLYYAIAALTGYELGIIAIVIGIGVGKAVRRGAGLNGHWTVRALAVSLTWLSIASTTVPAILDAMGPDATGPSALAIALCLGALSPFLLLAEGQFMSVIILAIGLWEGWRYSAAPRVSLQGPFRVGAGPAADNAPAAGNAPTAADAS
jgi:hypothetical protein